MKKIVVRLLLLSLVASFICGCSGTDNKKGDNNKNTGTTVSSEADDNEELLDKEVYIYRYDAETGKVSEYYGYDHTGKITSKKCYAQNGSIAYIVEYDAYENEINRIEYEAGVENKTRYEYDTEGKKKSGTKYENDVCIGKYVYEYDADNRLSKEIYYNAEEQMEMLSDYSYYSDGRSYNKSITYYWNGVEFISGGERYLYDDNGNLIEASGYKGDIILFWEFYEYDENGDIILHSYWDGEKEDMFIYSYIKTSLGDYISNKTGYEEKTQIEQTVEKSKTYYASVLAEYRIAEQIGFVFLQEYFNNVNDLFYQYQAEDTPLYYALKDLNGDGIEELIIAIDSTSYSVSETGGTINENNEIYDIFTYDGNSVQKIVEKQERIYYWVCENGYIKCRSSGGAYYNGIDYYTLDEREPVLLLVGGVKQEDMAYFETTPGREQIITKEEYEAFEDKYPICENFEWIKLNSGGE